MGIPFPSASSAGSTLDGLSHRDELPVNTSCVHAAAAHAGRNRSAQHQETCEFKLVRGDGSPTRRVLRESIGELEEYGGLTWLQPLAHCERLDNARGDRSWQVKAEAM